MSTAADVRLGDEIAGLLAGTGRPLTAEQIAYMLVRRVEDISGVLLRDNRFESRSVWNMKGREADPIGLRTAA